MARSIQVQSTLCHFQRHEIRPEHCLMYQRKATMSMVADNDPSLKRTVILVGSLQSSELSFESDDKSGRTHVYTYKSSTTISYIYRE